MDLQKLDSLINKFGAEFIKRMQDEITANNSVATGTLKNSVQYNYSTDTDKIVMQFLSEDYGKYVEGGRAKGTYPPLSKIQQWCSVKGIPVSAAFAISKKIYKFGIKPKPYIFNDFESMKHDFIIELMAVYGSLVKIEVMDMMNQIPKQIP